MIFNVFFNPHLIGFAAEAGPYGLEALCSALRGFSANCLLFDFEDQRGQADIRQQLDSMPENFDRSIVKRLFATLKKRRRFVFILEADYFSEKSDLDQALDQADKVRIDLFLSDQLPTVPLPTDIEFRTLSNYQASDFEHQRSETATNGRTYVGGDMDAVSFLNFNFAKALRHAHRIEICDRLLGDRFADNFEFTIKELLRWLETILHEPDSCELTIHCGKTAGRDQHFAHTLKSFRRGRISGTKISINFYHTTADGSLLPHGRYLWSDQFAFEIDRGMDFLNRATGNNRDVSINIKDQGEITLMVLACSATRANTETI